MWWVGGGIGSGGREGRWFALRSQVRNAGNV